MTQKRKQLARVPGASLGPAVVGKAPPQTATMPKFHLVVPCRDEADQRDLYEELRRRGYRCRVLSI
ncbi:MAG: hypothetical protein K8T25_17550 [Planctomycetia bacterium]|nr:hypothetical protein [Planctomycetia bacterium]